MTEPGSQPPPERPARAGGPRADITRRAVMLGVGAAGIGVVGAVAGRFVGTREETPSHAAVVSPPVSDETATATPPDPPPATVPAVAATPTPSGPVVPRDMAIVTSPRLPLFGIGEAQAQRLLAGKVTDWRELGSAIGFRPEPLALPNLVPASLGGAEVVRDYDDLAAQLAGRPGGFALVPIEQVDFRVNSLSIGLDDPLLAGPSPAFRVGVVGDIVPGRNVAKRMIAFNDYTHPFLVVAPLLSGFDLTIANLEGNLSSTLVPPEDPHSFSFVANPAMLDGFALAGIDAVSLANNHTVWNDEGWGVQGLLDTIAALDGHAIPYFGAGGDIGRARAPWLTTVGGQSMAWLGIDGVTANHEVQPGRENGVLDFDAGATADRAGTNPYVSEQFLQDIAAAAAQASIVIPYFHFGEEYAGIVPVWAANGARAAIDAGATMVVTNHPHVVQGMEVYNGRPIVYSPGNFILDQMWGVEVRSSHALEIGFRGTDIVRIRCHGIEIEDFNQPRPMTAGEQANLMDRFWTSTDRLAARDG